MTTEQCKAPTVIPHWLRVLLAVVSTIAVFRVCTIILGFVLWQIRGTFFPLFIQEFLYRWDTLLVPVVAVTAAVLFARWIEPKLAQEGFRPPFLLV